jgi:23S rRNA (uracil1939-C5)-methyltransferase
MTAEEIVVVIDKLGGRGDGIAETPEGLLYVPFTLPGDKVRVRPKSKRGDGRSAQLIDIIESGPGRVTPPCAHFGDCGGCTLQHLDPVREKAWKRELVVEVLARRGFSDTTVGETVSVPIASRRRTTLKALRAGG